MTVSQPATVNILRGFNPYLHGARGLFSLMIVFFHVVNSGLPTFAIFSQGPLLFGVRSLEFGVELFFGISGIVIAGALSRAPGPLVFALERGTRIYPVLWATVLTIVVLAGISGTKGSGWPSLPVLAANLLALPPLLPGPLIHPAAWSLSYELAFYGFCAASWALLLTFGRSAYLLIVPTALFAVESHVRIAMMPIGMGVALLLARRPDAGRYVPAPGLCIVVFLLLWEAAHLGTGRNLTYLGWHDLRPPVAGLALLAVLVAAVGFVGILTGRGLAGHLFRTGPMQFLGTISYSLYLWHPIIMAIIKQGMHKAHVPQHAGVASQLIFLSFSLPTSILVAWISQLLLERRVTAYLRIYLERLFGQRPRRAVPITVEDPA